MEVTPGYKQTEVGVIPEDWDVVLVTSLLALPIQNGVFNEPSRKGRGCKLINVIDLYGSFPIDTKDLERFDADRDELLRFGVKDGDLFFTRSSLTPDGIAKCNAYRGDGSEEVVFDCHIIRVRPNSSKAEPFYLARYCNSRPARSYLIANAKTTTMTTIDQSVVAKLPLALPPLPEQRAISTALRDVDGLLGGLDRLIAKKRDLKWAATQQLLTGQTRLPGFHGDWAVRTLKHSMDCLDGVRVPLNEAQRTTMRGDYPYCGANGVLGYVSGYVIDDDIILMAEDGGYFEEYETRPIAYRMKGRCWVNNHAHILKAKSGFDQGFLFYSLVHKNILPFLVSGTRAKLNKAEMNKIEVYLPEEQAEQAAIAEVLMEMDAELAALEQRREKTRAVKEAVMQELLTGRTRLI